MGWKIRGTYTSINEKDCYDGSDTLFSFEVHHRGVFNDLFPGRRYLTGRVNYVDYVDIEEFSVHELDFMLTELGLVRTDDRPVYYHFMIPNTDIDFGLQALGNDYDVRELGKYVKENKLIKLYVEHGESKLRTYFATPFESPRSSKCIIEELDDGPIGKLPVRRPKRKKLLEWKGEGCSGEQPIGPQVNEPVLETVNEPVLETVNENFVYDFENFDKDFPFDDKNEGNNVADDGVNARGKEKKQGKNVANDGVNARGEDKKQGKNVADDGVNARGKDKKQRLNKEKKVVIEENQVENEGSIEYESSNGSVQVGSDCGHEVSLNEHSFDSAVSDDGLEVDRERELKKLRRKKAREETKDAFYVGQIFGDREEVKRLINKHSVETKRNIVFIKNDNDRVRAVCKGVVQVFKGGPENESETKMKMGQSINVGQEMNMGQEMKEAHDSENSCNEEETVEKCPWVIYVPRLKDSNGTWMVKTYCSEHKCATTRNLTAFTTGFLAQEEWVVGKMESNPKISITAMQQELQAKYQLEVSRMQAHRTKTRATDLLRGNYAEQYQRLRDYIQELRSTNPGTTVKVQVESDANPDLATRVFKRIYICLGALKEGFKACCRELLGLDGAFMKGPFPSQMLTAVGLDPNNGIYPLAYGVVEAENKDSWTWFLQCLADDLDLPPNANFTFISDRQKGIIPALATVFPCAEHRFCFRHIHQNMKQQWRGKAFKDLIWGAATARTQQWFEDKMAELKALNEDAHTWLSNIPAKHWSRYKFSERAHTDLLLNNLCEVFNSKLVDGREKPIISALEYVMEYLMKRHVSLLKQISKAQGPLTPTSEKIFEERSEKAYKYKALWNGGKKFQVTGPWNDQVVVDIIDKTCTCRKWQLTGLPCKHAIATNWEMNLLNMEIEGGPESWIHPCHWLDTWKKVYSFKLNPTNGRKMWVKDVCPTTLVPPFHHTPVGRPKKKRRKSQVEIEDMVQGNKISRAGNTVVCSICKNPGHNKRSCKGQGGQTGQRVQGGGSGVAGGSGAAAGGSAAKARKQAASGSGAKARKQAAGGSGAKARKEAAAGSSQV